MWRTAELLLLLTANFRKTISSSVKQIVLLFFVRCKKNISQAFEFASDLLQSVSKQTHSPLMSIGNYAGVRVCLDILRPCWRKKTEFAGELWHIHNNQPANCSAQREIDRATAPCECADKLPSSALRRSVRGFWHARLHRPALRCTARGKALAQEGQTRYASVVMTLDMAVMMPRTGKGSGAPPCCSAVSR